MLFHGYSGFATPPPCYGNVLYIVLCNFTTLPISKASVEW